MVGVVVAVLVVMVVMVVVVVVVGEYVRVSMLSSPAGPSIPWRGAWSVARSSSRVCPIVRRRC